MLRTGLEKFEHLKLDHIKRSEIEDFDYPPAVISLLLRSSINSLAPGMEPGPATDLFDDA